MATRVTWLSVYDRLWLAFHKESFRFEDAMNKIYPGKKKPGAKQLKYASKIMNEIEDNGYAIHKKAEYDQRVYLYRLLSPEKVTQAWGIYSPWGSKNVFIDNIAEHGNSIAKWNYMKIKDSAIAFWSNNYRETSVSHFSISEDDLDGWISLFKLFDYTVIVNGVIYHETKSKPQAVHLHADLKEREHQAKEMIDHVQPMRFALAEGFADNDVLGALAILLRKRKDDWKKVIDAAMEYHVINALGFSLEALNREAGKQIFNSKIISQIHKNIERKIFTIGNKEEKSARTNYEDLEKKWNVKCFNYSAFEKAVLDLV